MKSWTKSSMSGCGMAMVLAIGVLLAGCQTLAGQPQFIQAAITPQQLKPGDSAVITVAVKDRHQVVDHIEGVVKEDPRITFRLRDDGQAPDETAGDGVWSMAVDVPFQAPPGKFELLFKAYREDGLPVTVREKQGGVRELQQQLPLVILYPQQ